MANHIGLNNWHKAYIAGICAVGMWLAATAPIGKVGKGIFLSISLMHSIALVRMSKVLIPEEAAAIAKSVMNRELQNTELVLQTNQLETELQRLYLPDGTSDGTYPPEVITELRESLEALWQTVAPESTSDYPASTSDLKALYLAIVSLLQSGKSETFVIEEVLGCRGRKYQEGKEILQRILQEGEANEW